MDNILNLKYQPSPNLKLLQFSLQLARHTQKLLKRIAHIVILLVATRAKVVTRITIGIVRLMLLWWLRLKEVIIRKAITRRAHCVWIVQVGWWWRWFPATLSQLHHIRNDVDQLRIFLGRQQSFQSFHYFFEYRRRSLAIVFIQSLSTELKECNIIVFRILIVN